MIKNVPLTDGHVRNVASLDGAFVDAHHILVSGNVSLALGIDGNSGPFSETKTMSVFDDRISSNLQSDLVEPSVARLGKRLDEIETSRTAFLPVFEGMIADGDRRRAVEAVLGSDLSTFESSEADDNLEG